MMKPLLFFLSAIALGLLSCTNAAKFPPVIAQTSASSENPSIAQTAASSGLPVPTNPFLADSPWAVPTGERVVWGATSTHMFKAFVKGDQFKVVADYQIDREILEVNWSLAVLKGNKVIVPDRNQRRFLRFADSDSKNPRSPIKIEAVWQIPPQIKGKSVHFNICQNK
ncbi:MAG: hypothetical protein KME45_26495 [Stenomitos rutilans HA7619-LM2]|jgi:hypothetical protein|nr:hypothetical protein [Stenomitos rutilans HA7619-LM2]